MGRGVDCGVFLPIGLDGDRGGTCVRVILESPLNASEEKEWVEHFVGRLVVDDGRLMICGSTDFLDEQQFVDSDMVQELLVPPGVYRVDVYACFVGIIGWEADHRGFIGDDGERVGAWFRRTRPGEQFPLWLRLLCHQEPDHDPDHEGEWSTMVELDDLDEDEKTSWVDFMIRLTRIPASAKVPTAPLESGGFVPVTLSRRVPDRCPVGLKADIHGV